LYSSSKKKMRRAVWRFAVHVSSRTIVHDESGIDVGPEYLVHEICPVSNSIAYSICLYVV
jgi:hypothetical protein